VNAAPSRSRQIGLSLLGLQSVRDLATLLLVGATRSSVVAS
jgi:hypothetical protein